MDALPKQLAAELKSGLNFAVLERFLEHRRQYLLASMGKPKTKRECRQTWGQLEEVQWLSRLQALADITLNPENSR